MQICISKLDPMLCKNSKHSAHYSTHSWRLGGNVVEKSTIFDFKIGQW